MAVIPGASLTVEPAPASGDVLVDGHAHFRPCFSATGFLDAAVRNLRRWDPTETRAPVGSNRNARLCLMLADPEGRDSLEALAAESRESARWRILSTGEEVSRLAKDDDGETIGLIAGKQVVTDEGLEVLALATDAEVPGGRSLRNTVEKSLVAGAVTVLPWGFGKWWLRRGRVVRRLVESVDHPLFFLGDNGGRPRTAPEPSLFRAAERQGTAVLPGSDPLPFRREENRVGSYGFVVPKRVLSARNGTRPFPHEWAETPAAALRTGLGRLRDSPTTFGRRAGFGQFLLHQIGMQLATPEAQ